MTEDHVEKVCHRCLGKGRLDQAIDGPTMVKETCPTCGGDGHV
jgi:DnaJ-class molecular chaperone